MNNNETQFTEKQRFTQWWLWIILLGTNGGILYGVIQQVIFGKQFGDNPASDAGLLLIFALVVLISIFFVSLRLETVIKQDGIYVRYYPVHFSFRYYPWEDIQKAYVRKYKPIIEYGGWGFRGFGKNRALNVSGNQGLQLEFRNYKRLLIGTRKPGEIIEALHKKGLK